MTQTIQVKLTDQRCELGDAYAQKHLTTPPKVAVLSCEGMCLRGEIARRAANLIAHELAPNRTVRVCHGGLLETSGGMRELVEREVAGNDDRELVRLRSDGKYRDWLALTILGGLGFLAGQMHEYFGFFPGFPTHPLHGLVGEGLIPGHSAYASTFYLTTGFHGCHVLAGVVYLSTVLARLLAGKLDGRPGAVELAGLFWHFVDLVWILVFTLIYLIP